MGVDGVDESVLLGSSATRSGLGSGFVAKPPNVLSRFVISSTFSSGFSRAFF